MRKIVRVETASPIVGAVPDRECEILKSRFGDGLEWYRLRDLSSGAVFDSQRYSGCSPHHPMLDHSIGDKFLGCQGRP